MNKAKIIERLKDNDNKFWELTKEEQEIFKEVGKENCVYLNELIKDRNVWEDHDSFKFYLTNIYRIKKDYEYKESKSEIIERLKDNDKFFIGLTEEEQEVFYEVGKENCVYLIDNTWLNVEQKFGNQVIYRIKRDYKYKESKNLVTVVTLIFKGDTLIKKELTKIL